MPHIFIHFISLVGCLLPTPSHRVTWAPSMTSLAEISWDKVAPTLTEKDHSSSPKDAKEHSTRPTTTIRNPI